MKQGRNPYNDKWGEDIITIRRKENQHLVLTHGECPMRESLHNPRENWPPNESPPFGGTMGEDPNLMFHCNQRPGAMDFWGK